MRVDTQAMMRVRATTKARLRAFAAARRWKLTEAAEAAVDALEAAEKKDSRRKRGDGHELNVTDGGQRDRYRI